MNRFVLPSLVAALILTFPLGTPCLGAPGADEAMLRIDENCRAIDARLGTKGTTKRFFVRNPSGWKEYPSFNAAKADCEGGCYESAQWVSQGKKTSLADCFLSNESGDWALYLKYHFRADGSLARLSADLRHFNCFQQGDREQRFFLGQVFGRNTFAPTAPPSARPSLVVSTERRRRPSKA
jgi:hypothetical protein